MQPLSCVSTHSCRKLTGSVDRLRSRGEGRVSLMGSARGQSLEASWSQSTCSMVTSQFICVMGGN